MDQPGAEAGGQRGGPEGGLGGQDGRGAGDAGDRDDADRGRDAAPLDRGEEPWNLEGDKGMGDGRGPAACDEEDARPGGGTGCALGHATLMQSYQEERSKNEAASTIRPDDGRGQGPLAQRLLSNTAPILRLSMKGARERSSSIANPVASATPSDGGRLSSPRIVLVKRDEEHGFRPNFKNEAETMRLALSQEVQSSMLLREKLHYLKDRSDSTGRMGEEMIHLLQKLRKEVEQMPLEPVIPGEVDPTSNQTDLYCEGCSLASQMKSLPLMVAAAANGSTHESITTISPQEVTELTQRHITSILQAIDQAILLNRQLLPIETADRQQESGSEGHSEQSQGQFTSSNAPLLSASPPPLQLNKPCLSSNICSVSSAPTSALSSLQLSPQNLRNAHIDSSSSAQFSATDPISMPVRKANIPRNRVSNTLSRLKAISYNSPDRARSKSSSNRGASFEDLRSTSMDTKSKKQTSPKTGTAIRARIKGGSEASSTQFTSIGGLGRHKLRIPSQASPTSDAFATLQPPASIKDEEVWKPLQLRHLRTHAILAHELNARARVKHPPEQLLNLLAVDDDGDDTTNMHSNAEVKQKSEATKPKHAAIASENSRFNELEYQLAMNGLLDHERSFSAELQALGRLLLPLLDSDIERGECYSFFSNVEVLHGVTRELLQSLEINNLRPFEEQDVGACFLSLPEHAMAYRLYALHFPSLLLHLHQELQYGSRVSGLIIGRKTLQQELRRPLIHVASYPNSLQALLVHTPPAHQQFMSLSIAVANVEQLRKDIDIALPSQNSMDMLLLQRRFYQSFAEGEIALMTADRVFIKEGMFTKLSGHAEIICRRLLLFTDIILITRELQCRRSLLKAVIPLQHCLIFDHGEVSNTFELVRTDPSDHSFSVQLSAASREDKDSWVDEIAHAIIHLSPSQLGAEREAFAQHYNFFSSQ